MSGYLEVICGPMYAGKSEELIRRLTRFEIAKKTVHVISPDIDNRYGAGHINSHNGRSFVAEQIPVEGKAIEVKSDVVAFDEAQFFEYRWLTGSVKDLLREGYIVIAAGLDKDYRGEPFGGLTMPYLMAMADKITKLTAICQKCGEEATMTQRLVDGKPAPLSGPTVLVGATDSYEARCRDCWEAG